MSWKTYPFAVERRAWGPILDNFPHIEALTTGITSRRIVRLGYSRQRDGVLSLHHVAPIDIRPGDTPRTSATWYLWAYCFEEQRLEMHLLDRVRSANLTGGLFDPAEILAKWPAPDWPRPEAWIVPRSWD